MGIVSLGSLKLSNLGKALRSDPDGCFLIDLRKATFVEPSGLVAVAAQADFAASRGVSVEVLAPEELGCRNYMSRMGLGEALARHGVDHEFPPVRVGEVDTLCELRWFENEEQLEGVAATLMRQFQSCGPSVVQPLYQALFELGVNAVQHSGRGGGYVALQRFPSSDEVVFAVADCGVGLRYRLGAEADGRAIASRHVSTTRVKATLDVEGGSQVWSN